MSNEIPALFHALSTAPSTSLSFPEAVLAAAVWAQEAGADPIAALLDARIKALKARVHRLEHPPGAPSKERARAIAAGLNKYFEEVVAAAPADEQRTQRLRLVRMIALDPTPDSPGPWLQAARGILAFVDSPGRRGRKVTSADIPGEGSVSLATVTLRARRWLPWALPLIQKKG